MHRLSTSFVLGYHGCSAEVAERVLAGETFQPSANDYDWLGPGIYFWQSNPSRALAFAREKCAREQSKWSPRVIGAVIDLGLCLDLATAEGVREVAKAYEGLKRTYEAAGVAMPRNSLGQDLLVRKLDCAVILRLHAIRSANSEPAIDTVSGIFIEGGPVYEGSGFYEKTHVQLAVCNPACIRGVFRVSDSELV